MLYSKKRNGYTCWFLKGVYSSIISSRKYISQAGHWIHSMKNLCANYFLVGWVIDIVRFKVLIFKLCIIFDILNFFWKFHIVLYFLHPLSIPFPLPTLPMPSNSLHSWRLLCLFYFWVYNMITTFPPSYPSPQTVSYTLSWSPSNSCLLFH